MIDGYAIWDSLNNKWWETKSKKKFWNKQNHAASAWSNEHGFVGLTKAGYPTQIYLRDQTRFVVKAVTFKEV